MDNEIGHAARPHVSVVLTTRDRPHFLPLALAGYQQQAYPAAARELIVVDDGDRFPAAEEAVQAAGGRLLRVPPGEPLGSKLNAGIALARGRFIQKMDDDDWYGPQFLVQMLATLDAQWQDVCQPTLVFLSPFLLFDLSAWRVRRSTAGHMPGATLLFPRSLWEEAPFRPLRGDEDVWFLLDHLRLGARLATCTAIESFMAVRHAAVPTERAHTWTHQGTGEAVEEFAAQLPPFAQTPEEVLPDWAVTAYRNLRARSMTR